jgi:hypothetical protein
MPQNLPVTNPHTFHPSTTGAPDAHAAQALEFIAERMAGIEFILTEMNQKMFKMEAAFSLIAQKL